MDDRTKPIYVKQFIRESDEIAFGFVRALMADDDALLSQYGREVVESPATCLGVVASLGRLCAAFFQDSYDQATGGELHATTEQYQKAWDGLAASMLRRHQ